VRVGWSGAIRGELFRSLGIWVRFGAFSRLNRFDQEDENLIDVGF
jgi:hypothetical protein